MVSNTQVHSECWNQVFNVISTNVSNPNSANSKFIYTAFPDKDNIDKTAYPMLIINPIGNNSGKILTTTRGVKIFPLKLTIEAYHTNAEGLDTLCDSIFYQIENNEPTFYNNGLKNFVIVDSDSDTVFRGRIRVHYRRYVWNFEHHWVQAPVDVTPTETFTVVTNVTTAQRVALVPQIGYLVFDTDLQALFVWNGNYWIQASA